MSGAAAPGRRPADPRPIDWRHAALLLAQGATVAAVAAQTGCSRAQLSRRRNHDPVFRGLIDEYARAEGQPPARRLARLRDVLHEAIEQEVRSGNVRVILWLADRLKLVTPPDEKTPEEELRHLLGGLGPDELREFEALREPEAG